MNTTRELTRIRGLAARMAGRLAGHLGCVQDQASRPPGLPWPTSSPERPARPGRVPRAVAGLRRPRRAAARRASLRRAGEES